MPAGGSTLPVAPEARMAEQMTQNAWEANMTARSKHDIAYGCFLVPMAACLIAAIGGAVRMNDANAAGIGFFVLIPLTLASLAAIPVGVFYSILCRDGFVLLLSALTLILIAAFIAGAESIMEFGGAVYGILVLIIEGRWWFFRRRAYPA